MGLRSNLLIGLVHLMGCSSAIRPNTPITTNPAWEVVQVLKEKGVYHKEKDIITYTMAAIDTTNSNVLNYRLILGGLEKNVGGFAVFVPMTIIAINDTVHAGRKSTCMAADGRVMIGYNKDMSIDGYVDMGHYNLEEAGRFFDRPLEESEAQNVFSEVLFRLIP